MVQETAKQERRWTSVGLKRRISEGWAQLLEKDEGAEGGGGLRNKRSSRADSGKM